MSIIEQAQSNYKRDVEHWQTIYAKAKEDLFFLSDDEFAQWNQEDAQSRATTGRPVLTVDQLSQFVHQVANDIRLNTPSISVIPAGSGSKKETAEILKGLIRNIEYVSNADDVYDTAVLNSIKCSIGFIRVDHEYVNDEGFEQQLVLKRVVNPLAIVIDSDSIECDGRDAKHATITEQITVEEFKRRYPGKRPVSFQTEMGENEEKQDGEHITIAEYFYIEENAKEIGMNEDGEQEDAVEGKEYSSKRKVTKRKVHRCVLSGADELEKSTFPGKYIPIIPVYGEEAWDNGKRNLFSLIRKSKDAQRMYNYWKSLETELLMKQPQAPIMAAEGQIEQYADDWMNPSKAMALRYKQTDADGNPAPPPQRLEPPVIPVGVVNASRQTVDDIKATMGLYNASIGERSNETSGIAIQRRKEEGDVATYHFADNLNRSIAQAGRVLVCAIPEIYDSSRIIRIIDNEEEPQEVGVNGEMIEEQEEEYDLTQGIYDVRVQAGAPYSTRRQEAAQFFSEVVSKQPELMNVMGDLLFKNMDFTGAPAMAERMKKLIDPKLLEENAEEQAPDPEKEQMAQIIEQGAQEMQAMQQQLMQLQEQLKSKQEENVIKAQEAAIKAEEAARKFELEMRKLDQQERENLSDAEIKRMDLELKQQALALKEREIEAKQRLEAERLMLDALESEQKAFREESSTEGSVAQYQSEEM